MRIRSFLAALGALCFAPAALAQVPQPPAHTVALPALPRVTTIAPTDYLLGISGATGTPGSGQPRLMPVPALPVAAALAGLTDVLLTSPVTGQALTYNAGTGKWANAAIPSVPGGSSNQLQINNGGVFGGITLAGDCTFASPNITCLTLNGIARVAINGDTMTGDLTAPSFQANGAAANSVPSGTTAQRPGSPSAGMMRWNTDTGRLETYTGSAWANHVRLSGDTMTGALVLNADPAVPLGAVTKQYADAHAGSTSSGASGLIQLSNGSGGFTAMTAMSGDCALNTGTGAIICLKTNGTSFAVSATTDTTNAANISSGTLPAARLPTAATWSGISVPVCVNGVGCPTTATPDVYPLPGPANIAASTTPAALCAPGKYPAATVTFLVKKYVQSGGSTTATTLCTGSISTSCAVSSCSIPATSFNAGDGISAEATEASADASAVVSVAVPMVKQ